MVLTITNQKGGVGKTTTAHTMGAGLAKRGFNVLLIDSDPQMNLSYTAGIMPGTAETDLYDLFKGKKMQLADLTETTAGFYLIPGSLDLIRSEEEFTEMNKYYIIKEIIEPIKERFDFIIIDTPPAIGMLTINALTASDCVVVPMGADIYSFQGLSQLQGVVENVKRYCNNPGLYIDGLLLTKYNSRSVINRQLKDDMQEIAQKIGSRLYKTQIREAVAVKEVQLLKSDLFAEYPKAKITKDYNNFIDEFMEGMKDNDKEKL